jgi:hypothetical protein
MPPKRKAHPLLSSFTANYPRVMHSARVAAASRIMPSKVVGGIGGFGMMPTSAMPTAMGYGGLLLGGAKKRRETVGRAKNQARGALIRQIMMQKGMSLAQASHYIKANNIPY